MDELIILAYLREIIESMIEVDFDLHELKILKDAKILLEEKRLIIQDVRGIEYRLKIERK